MGGVVSTSFVGKVLAGENLVDYQEPSDLYRDIRQWDKVTWGTHTNACVPNGGSFRVFIEDVDVSALHNGNILAIRLSWSGQEHSKILDFDEFVDGAAVMFPLTENASAITMGSESDPVNAWYWKANLDGSAFDVIARGYGTSGRHTSARHPITSKAVHQGRPLEIGIGPGHGKQ